eukprot:11714739-Prorocentrum_lima.AAC.1
MTDGLRRPQDMDAGILEKNRQEAKETGLAQYAGRDMDTGGDAADERASWSVDLGCNGCNGLHRSFGT